MRRTELFALRGPLSSRDGLILTIVGAVLLFALWWVLAEALSRTLVTQTDDEAVVATLSQNARRYYDNDSLLIADLDRLETLPAEELSGLGLTRRKTYPLLPTPLRVLKAIPELIERDDLIGNALYSIQLNLLGYLVAILVAIPVGFLLGLIPLVRGLFSKIFDSYRFIPLTAVTGIFIMWLGLGSDMKVAFLAFGIIVYLIPVVVQRIDEVSKVYLNTVFTLGATSWQTVRTVYMPYVFSKIIDDVRVLTAISWTYITIVEMLNRGGGIGELIWTAKRQSRIDKAFAILIIIVLIGIVQDRLFALLDRLLFPHKYVASAKTS